MRRAARAWATFLPLFGPLPESTDFVRSEDIAIGNQITIADTDTIKLPTLQVKVYLRGAQMKDPELTSVLALFRRAANLLARLEDAIIFNGQPAANQVPAGGPPNIWEVRGGQPSRGLFAPQPGQTIPAQPTGQSLVTGVSESIGRLEANGHFGPFSVVLDQGSFLAAQTPDPGLARLAAGPHRSVPGRRFTAPLVQLPRDSGVVVALGGCANRTCRRHGRVAQLLTGHHRPVFVFRVYEKMALRIKEPEAIIALGRARGARRSCSTRSASAPAGGAPPAAPHAGQPSIRPHETCPQGSSSWAVAWPA